MAQRTTISEVAAAHIASVEKLQDEHDVAIANVADLRAEVARLTATVQMQDSELAAIRSRARYYEHFAITLVTQLHDVGHIITSAIAKAREVGHDFESKPTAVNGTLDAISAAIETQVETLEAESANHS